VINKVVFNGLNLPDCYPISPVSPWYSTTKGLKCNLKADVAQAKKLVAQSGVKTPITVHLMLGTDPVNARLGQVIQAMEKQIGIDVVLDPTEFVSSLNKADAGTFETFAVGWSGRVDPDGNIYQFVATTGSQNDSGYSNPRLDLILNNARKAATEKARKTLYRAAQRIMLEDRPLIYLYHNVTRAGLSVKLTGVRMYPDTLTRVAFASYK